MGEERRGEEEGRGRGRGVLLLLLCSALWCIVLCSSILPGGKSLPLWALDFLLPPSFSCTALVDVGMSANPWELVKIYSTIMGLHCTRKPK